MIWIKAINNGDVIMAESNQVPFERWATSNIQFGSEELMKRCITALEVKTNESINASIEGNTVCLEGQFDYGQFEEEFEHIIAEYCLPEQVYSVKCIYLDDDGFFGGWVAQFNGKGKAIKEFCLSQMFDEVA